jgi:hypothetical protein
MFERRGREKEEKRKRDGEKNGWVTIYTDVWEKRKRKGREEEERWGRKWVGDDERKWVGGEEDGLRVAGGDALFFIHFTL